MTVSISQRALEVGWSPTLKALVSQRVLEVGWEPQKNLHISQRILEVAFSVTPPAAGRVLGPAVQCMG
jgi:hypothetical protein